MWGATPEQRLLAFFSTLVRLTSLPLGQPVLPEEGLLLEATFG